MSRPRKAKWAALAAVTMIAVAAATVGVTFGAFAGETAAAGNNITAMPDFRGPTISRIAIGQPSGTTTGSIRAGNSYRVYADVDDVGTPPSGVDVVTADVSTVTTGQTAVSLTAGSYTAGGQSFNYASASLTANAGLPQGPRAFSVRATDFALNSTNVVGSVTIDGTAPTAVDIQASGGVAGRPEVGDTMTLTFSEAMDPNSILPGWDGTATTVVAGFANAGGGDLFQVWNTALTTQARFGTISMGRTDFTTGNLGFMGSTMTMSGSTVTITLGGAISGTVTTVGGTGTMRWTPSNQATDAAGNAMSTTARNETGAADRDF